MPGVPLVSRYCPDLCSITQHVEGAHIRTIHVIPECQTSMTSCKRVIQRLTSLEHIAHQSLLYIQFSDPLTLISTWADLVQVTLIRAHFHVSMYNGNFLFCLFLERNTMVHFLNTVIPFIAFVIERNVRMY